MSEVELGELNAEQRLDWLRLWRSENVGPITFGQLLARFGSARAALEAVPELARRGGRRGAIRICSAAEAEREVAATRAAGARLVALCEPDYPRPLAAIPDAPPLLAVKGHAHLFAERTIAIVGARNASAAGVRFARDISRELGQLGFVIASGLARGIDTAAHEGALESGTVAVLAGGIDVVYPAENEGLYGTIVEQGAVIAEQPVGKQPQGRHFPSRNRLISGLSLGVLVVEAALRSGSLITARMALEQNREVFAVPGSPLDPRCRGSNRLIRDGAALIETADHVIEALENLALPRLAEAEPELFPAAPAAPASEPEAAGSRDLVAGKLCPTPIGVDEILRQCRLTPAVLLTILLELELAGRLQRHPGNQISLL
ncbi:MAG: DNA-processing protein DprA [Alphaproteobacteria bacterium]|jgi:DNA processing protein|nr:DNA-processing protein DprA [Alphaproteobacteria bacterium]